MNAKEWLLWTGLAVVNVPVFILYGKLLFDDWEGFLDALRFWLKPDLLSLLHGEYWEDWWAELKFAVFLSTLAGLLVAEHHFVIAPLLQHWAR